MSQRRSSERWGLLECEECTHALATQGLKSTNATFLLQSLGEVSYVEAARGIPVLAVLRLIEVCQLLLPGHPAEIADLIRILEAVGGRDSPRSDWSNARARPPGCATEPELGE